MDNNIPISSETAISHLHTRNKRVEADKAWETSWMRKSAIMVITYAIVVLWLNILGVQGAPLHALVPVLGYLLSTLSLPILKKHWIKKYYSETEE